MIYIPRYPRPLERVRRGDLSNLVYLTIGPKNTRLDAPRPLKNIYIQETTKFYAQI